MFSAFAAGICLVVTGFIGLDVSNLRGNFQGTRWVEGQVWWQIALGSGLLLLGVFFSRHLGGPRWMSVSVPRVPAIKDVGAGKSAGAAKGRERRGLASGPPRA